MNLVFKKLSILSDLQRKAFSTSFNPRFHLILAKGKNSVGKSSIVKSIFWCLGCEPRLDSNWKSLNCKVLLEFSVAGTPYWVARHGSRMFLSTDGSNYETYSTTTGEFAQRIAGIVNFNILLQKWKTEEVEVPPPAYYFTPFYVDQKQSWSNAWVSFDKLGQYPRWQSDTISTHTGVYKEAYFKLTEDLFETQRKITSSNNSATANVLEKLQKYDLGFLAAFLGSAENKKQFIEGQSGERVQLPSLEAEQAAEVRKQIARLNNELDAAFETKNKLADVVQQINALQIEMTHFDLFQEDTDNHPDINGREFFPKVSTRKLLKCWLDYERKPRHVVSFLDKLKLVFRFGLSGRFLFGTTLEERIPLLQRAYYLRKMKELKNKKAGLDRSLTGFRFDDKLEQLTGLSMKLLKHRLAKRYTNRDRKVFELEDLWQQPNNFLKEYPVVLSTTFSVITSIRNGYLFDCVIVDEASQVDLLNGVLAMACAEKFVVVGDPAQLPNVLTDKDRMQARKIARDYEVPDYVQFEQHNLLSAVRSAFPKVPETLLREHYRCHPKIIQFCNQKFYGSKLLIMTRDQGEPDVIKAYVTVAGHHARGLVNQRQVDEILQSILPELGSFPPDAIGIISPYRAQTSRIREAVGATGIEVDTVHKYQGREKRVIIISTVSNEANDFVDDPNLLNVAISRAQEKLRLVVSKEMEDGRGNIADFVKYIRYNNCEVVPGKVRSVFDLLYREYTALRLEFLRQRRKVSIYDSENLAYLEIEGVLQEKAYREFSITLQFPISTLIKDTRGLTEEEAAYASHPWTRADFLIYRKVDKSPVLVVEVDGYAFHREGSRQAERDVLKDSVLNKAGVPILRLSTTGSNERERIKNKLKEII